LNGRFKPDSGRNFPCPAIAHTGVATEAALILHRATILRKQAQLYERKRWIPGIQDPIEDVLHELSDFVLERSNAFIQRMVSGGFAADRHRMFIIDRTVFKIASFRCPAVNTHRRPKNEVQLSNSQMSKMQSNSWKSAKTLW
jgi:hypothetical protein